MISSKILKLLDRRVGFFVAAALILLSSAIPAVAGAAMLTERSIALSSSSADADNVTYKINFTAAGAAEAFIVDFCSNSPVIGQTCATPGGFSATAADSITVGFTDVTALDANTIMVEGTIGATDDIEVDVSGINNPTASGPLYARIITYDLATNADDYTSTVLGSGVVDEGGAAISITDTIGVSGAVLESLSFCVSGDPIDADCDVDGNAAPVLALGETVGDSVALTSSEVSEGTVYTQISTNAVGGAVVRLKSSAVGCGGLVRSSDLAACNIAPALTSGIVEGEAKFGVKTSATTDSAGADAVGDFEAVDLSGYNTSTYALNYVDGDATGVTSTFGDPFLDTKGAPANNKNVALTFGASISNSTPAGLYSVDLSLIATGKF